MDPTFAIDMVTVDCHDAVRLAGFWSAATGCPVVADYGGYVIVGSSPALGFQQVEHPTPGKNRVHLDAHPADRAGLVQRLRTLGATELQTHTAPGLTWTVMSDPEGNEFCVGQPDSASEG